MRNSILVLTVFLFSGNFCFADCPSDDLNGDCIVSFEDFAALAEQWLEEGVMPYSDLRRDDIAAQEAGMSTANIDASDDNEFMPGTYFIYKTNEGRFGKFMVENCEPGENHRLTMRWVTYDADGSVYSSGTRLLIRGTWSCDLDQGLETTTGRDWNWFLATSTSRRLVPKNGAKFRLMHRAKAPDGMVWVYVDDLNVIYGYEGYMSKYATTNAQYCQYLNSALADGLITVYNDVVYAASDISYSKPYLSTYTADSLSQITYDDGNFGVRTRDSYDMSNHPVVEVSWYGATAFCDYYSYRLPAEWEWLAVANYDGSFTYGCGTTVDHSKANYDWDNPLNLSSYPYTTPVDYYSSYGYGMNDMAGNVWEWTDSCCYDQCEPDSWVLRGGAWNRNAEYCRVAYRYCGDPTIRYGNVGFRVVLDLE